MKYRDILEYISKSVTDLNSPIDIKYKDVDGLETPCGRLAIDSRGDLIFMRHGDSPDWTRSEIPIPSRPIAQEICNKLFHNFDLKDRIGDENVFFETSNIVIQYVAPHAGNNFTYLVMANHKDTFSKWGKCSYEKYINTYVDLDNMINELLCMDSTTWDVYEDD